MDQSGAGGVGLIPRERLEELLHDFKKRKMAVIGDLYLDRYGVGVMEGIAREAPVPIVRLKGSNANTYSPGGGSNVCANVADLGPKTYPISVFGEDLHGYELKKQLEQRKIDTRFIEVDASRVTPTFEKFFASAHGSPIQQVGRVDMENDTPLGANTENRLVDSIRAAAGMVDAFIIADYAETAAAQVITPKVLETIVEIAAEGKVPIISDSRTRIQMFKYTMAVPNEYEAAVAAGLYEPAMAGVIPDDIADKSGDKLSSILGRPCFITRGPKAMSVHHDGVIERVQPKPTEGEIDTCGAGDTVDAGIAAAIASGASLLEAAEVGDLAANVTIKKIGTTGTATPEEILGLYDNLTTRR